MYIKLCCHEENWRKQTFKFRVYLGLSRQVFSHSLTWPWPQGPASSSSLITRLTPKQQPSQVIPYIQGSPVSLSANCLTSFKSLLKCHLISESTIVSSRLKSHLKLSLVLHTADSPPLYLALSFLFFIVFINFQHTIWFACFLCLLFIVGSLCHSSIPSLTAIIHCLLCDSLMDPRET